MSYALDIGIDLGTSNIVIYIKGKGIVLREPAVLAYDRDSERIKAFGEEARQMIGRTPGNIAGIRPIKEGVISDYIMTEQMLTYFIRKAMGRRGFFKPRIVIGVPNNVTEVERRAIREATFQAGAREVIIVPEALAAGLGAGIDITRPEGNMIIDIGGGVTDIAIVAAGGISKSVCIKYAGNQFTESIIRYLRKTHLLFIGEQSAEAIKIKIGAAKRGLVENTIEVKGRNIFTGLPSRVVLNTDEIVDALAAVANRIADAVCSELEQTTPEIANDISRRGIMIAGGGARLKGLDDIIREKTGIDAYTVDSPESVVALGAVKYLEVMSKYD